VVKFAKHAATNAVSTIWNIAESVLPFATNARKHAWKHRINKMIRKSYTHLEIFFERLSEFVLQIMGSSITFLLAFVLVIYWLSGADFSEGHLRENIRDFLISITFLTFFMMK
jgi:hypothetical protein